jgi:fibronectin-binding autotransporter adhesin
MRRFFSLICIFFISLAFNSKILADELGNLELPTGGEVVSGDISIQKEAGKLIINQNSSKGIIEWQKFNVGADASVYFNHKNNTDSILNQIVGGSKSIILGNIFSNGKLFVNNPNGITVGANASINAHSFIGSAMKIANQDFLNHNYHYKQDRESLIDQNGNIDAQYVALMATDVTNSGTINSKNGSVNLAASDDMVLKISSDNSLQIKVKPSKLKATVSNKGIVIAENGVVTIKADMAQDAIAATIKAPENQAKGLVSKNGVIKLVSNSGTIKAKKVTLDAGQRGAVENTGKIDTSSATSKGGSVELIGKEVIIKSGSEIKSNGKKQGGNIYVGNPTLLNSVTDNTFVTLENNTILDVSSLEDSAGVVKIRTGKSSNGSMTSVNGVILARTGSSRRKDLANVAVTGYDVNLNEIYIDVSSTSDSGGSIHIEATNDVVGGKISLISNGKNEGGDINVVSLFGDVNLQQSIVQTNASLGRGGTVNINAKQNIFLIDSNLYARGSPEGGNVTILSSANDVNLKSTLVQTNGSTGRGGTLDIKAKKDIHLIDTYLNAIGSTEGGNVTILSISNSVNLKSTVVQTNSSTGRGGTIFLDAHNNITINSSLQTNSAKNTAGTIVLVANHILVQQNSIIEAKGALGGGTILIGGSWQNSNPNIRQAITTTAEAGSVIDASATENGDGGTVVLWSDIYDVNSITVAKGTIAAEAGFLGGNGGNIETSGAILKLSGISISTNSIHGQTGLWLLDPTNDLNLGSVGDGDGWVENSTEAGTITTALNSSDVRIYTASANIIISSDIIYTGDNYLTIDSGGALYIRADVRAGGISLIAKEEIIIDTAAVNLTANRASNSLGQVVISADYDGNDTGTNKFTRALTITTNGGDVYLGGGNTSGTNYGNSTDWEGIEFTGLTINTNGGDVNIRGESDNANGLRFAGGTTINTSGGNVYMRGETENYAGIYFVSNTSINSGSGTIYLEGYNTTSASDYGIYTNASYDHLFQSSNTTSDAIKFVGHSDNLYGLYLYGDVKIYATGANGGITLETNGTASSDRSILFSGGSTEILAHSGPILFDVKQASGTTDLYINNNVYLGSKSDTSITTSSSDITIRGNLFNFSGYNPYIATTGIFTLEPVSTSTSFDQNVSTSWWSWNQNSQTLSGLTFGKSGNTRNITHETNALTVNGPVNFYGGNIYNNAALTVSGDVNFIASTLVDVNSNITKTSGSSATLTLTAGSIDINADISSSSNALNLTSNAATMNITSNLSLNGGDLRINNSSNVTFSGTFSGSGNLYQLGAGQLTLSGNNTYSGTTHIYGKYDLYSQNSLGSGQLLFYNGSTLLASSGGAAKTISNNINLVSGSTTIDISFGTSSDFNLSGIISGSGKIVLTGDVNSRWVNLSGNNTFSGGIDINSSSAPSLKPIVRISHNSALGSGTITSYGTTNYSNIVFMGNYSVSNAFVTNSSSTYLNFDTQGYTVTLSGVLSGAGTVSKAGSGTLNLSGASNNLTGDLVISAGELATSGSGRLASTYSGDISNSGTLNYGSSATTTSSGVTSGSGVVKVSAGTVTLSGTNTYTGETQITGGTLIASNTQALGTTAAATTVSSGATLKFASGLDYTTSEAITLNGGTISNSGTASFVGNITLGADSYFSPATSSTLTLSGVIADGGSDYGITINSSGTLILSGTNTYTGNTTISNGTLKIGKAGVISDNSNLVVNGTFDMNGFSETIASLSGSGTVTSSRVASVNSDDSGLIVYLDAGSYSGSGNWLDLTNGSPNATLGNSPSFNSDTNSFSLNGTDQYFSLGTTSTLQFGGTANYTINVWFKTDDASVNQSLLSRFDGSVLGSYRLDISNGKLFAHREANPWQTIGVTNINDGEINLASMTYNGTTLSLYLNGVLESSANIGSIGNNTIEALIGSVKSNGTRTNFFDGDIYSVQVYNTALSAETLLGNTKVELTTSSNSSSTFSGVLENGNAAKVDITKTGSGTLTLSANNTYTGQTNINAGIISITHNNALGSADGATIVADGASLSISNDITSQQKTLL